MGSDEAASPAADVIGDEEEKEAASPSPDQQNTSHECLGCVLARRSVRPRKMMTGNMFLVMRQNDLGHDKDRDFIRVFKYCYFSVNKYLQRVHLLYL